MSTQTAEPIKSTLETLGLLSDPATTAKSLDSKDSSKQSAKPLTEGQQKKKRSWLDKWLSLSTTAQKITDLENAVWEFISAYYKNPARGRTLVLTGENGCGKTKTAMAIHNWATFVAREHPVSGHLPVSEFVQWPLVVDALKRKEFSIVEDLVSCELMIVDDVGAEHDPSGFGSEQLYLIMSQREFKWNIFTTNFSPEDWPKRFERRIASRLYRNAEHIDLRGVPDYSTI